MYGDLLSALRREVVEARKAAEVAKCEVANSEEALLKMDGVGQAYEELKVVEVLGVAVEGLSGPPWGSDGGGGGVEG